MVGGIVNAANDDFRNLNIVGKHALDLRTKKPDGTSWDFTLAQDRKQAKDIVINEKPDWLVGSPPCTQF